jgi:hypothetical protein
LNQPNLTEDDLHHRIWVELQRAPHDRHHEWRTPVLASTGLDGFPQARTVVLRSADRTQAKLTFFTDSRSPKVAELQARPNAALLFWSKRLSWQLRVSVLATVMTQGEAVDAAWQRVSQSPAAGDYLSAAAPGAACAPDEVGVYPQHNLCIVSAQVLSMDWLALSKEGHRRARVSADSVAWCVP